jgi:malonyl-CoA decarboxylase
MSFLADLISSISQRGRALVEHAQWVGGRRDLPPLDQMCEALLSSRGEASGVALATMILDRYACMNDDDKCRFLCLLVDQFGADEAGLAQAIASYQAHPDHHHLMALHQAAEPRRQELIRRLNLSSGGTQSLVRMREDLFRFEKGHPGLAALDADFRHLFSSWFNRGFLVLRPIDWQTPANILEKIIRYEAVHAIKSWDDLRSRLAPPDRRCFAFFHPQIVDDPLIFVEVALTADIPASITDVLTDQRVPLDPKKATTAVFYSISNCQEGLRGISFGNFLIKQVVEELTRQGFGLKTFVTLSPVPGFAGWLARERKQVESDFVTPELKQSLDMLDDPAWATNPASVELLAPLLHGLAARYLLQARTVSGRVIDPVARFHLGNGARLERINVMADPSPKGLAQAHAVMVNYLYDLDSIEINHEAFTNKGEVVASAAVRQLLRQKTARETRNSHLL